MSLRASLESSIFLFFFSLILGALIDEELTVKPGTPLNMEIYLDNLSAGIYGLMVSGLDVTDTIQSQESLIVNGWVVVKIT